MRQNNTCFFHSVIVASLCCIVLTACAYKTNPVYVPEGDENGTSITTKGSNAKI